MKRQTSNKKTAPTTCGEKVPESPGDIAAGLVVEWRHDDATRFLLARVGGVVLRAGVNAWSIDHCSPVGVLGDEIAAGRERDYAANQRAAVLALARHIHAQRNPAPPEPKRVESVPAARFEWVVTHSGAFEIGHPSLQKHIRARVETTACGVLWNAFPQSPSSAGACGGDAPTIEAAKAAAEAALLEAMGGAK